MPDITRKFEDHLKSRLSQKLNFMQVVIGPRQVGKTTGVKNIFEAYQGPKVFVTADSPVPFTSDWLASHWQKARQLGDGVLLVVDEIQKVVGWAETLKLLFDDVRSAKSMKVVLLGSASLSIQDGLAGALSGRFELIKVGHWSPKESQEAFSWDFNQFIRYGGYPAASELIPDIHRWQSYIRDAIVEPVLGRDISGMVRINNPALFRQTFRLILQYPAQIVSYQKLLGQLQDRGNAATIKHYIDLLEGAFLVKQIHKYSGSSVTSTNSKPKILPACPALCNSFVDDVAKIEDPTWQGRVFESFVGMSLAALPGSLFYWSEGSYEVDFIRVVDGRVIAYEVKSGVSRRSKSMEVFRKKYPSASLIIVDREMVEQGNLGGN